MAWLERVRAIVVTTLVVTLVAGCGDGDEAERTPGHGPDRRELPASARPGAPMADGLTVPEGTWLAGTVFWQPTSEFPGEAPADPAPKSAPPDGWDAYLTIDGDPFKAFDELAAQLRERVGIPMGGTVDGCLWRLAQDTASPEPQVLLRVTAEPPPDATAGVECSSNATVEKDRRSVGYSLNLEWREGEPPSLEIHRSTTGLENAGIAFSLVTLVEPQIGITSPGQMRKPGPDRVPAEASDHLPDAPVESSAPVVAVGDEFGSGANCFHGGGGPRFRLPPGARVAADKVGGGSTSVLAVDDLEAVMADLLVQLEGDDPAAEQDSQRQDLTLQTGETLVSVSHVVAGGGGACDLVSSPDGAFLRIGHHSD